MLNYNYWCKDENRKKELLNLYYENQIKEEQELREKYNPDNLFKNKHTEDILKEKNEVSMTIYEEKNTFSKIINFIKNIFKK